MNTWIVAGIALQVAMVVAGHYLPALRNFWGPGGMLISLAVGAMAASAVPGSWSKVLFAGALAGGVGAFIGIFIAYVLKDVPPLLLVLGTVSSVVAGMIGSAIVHALVKQAPTG